MRFPVLRGREAVDDVFEEDVTFAGGGLVANPDFIAGHDLPADEDEGGGQIGFADDIFHALSSISWNHC
jgi:hypothetical protein